MKDGLIYT